MNLEAVQHEKCSSLFKPVDSPRGSVKVHFYSLNSLLFISASVRNETNQNYRSSKLKWLVGFESSNSLSQEVTVEILSPPSDGFKEVSSSIDLLLKKIALLTNQGSSYSIILSVAGLKSY